MLAALPVALHVRGRSEAEVSVRELGQFADPQASLDGQDQQGVIAPSCPGGAGGRGKECVDLVVAQVADLGAVVALGWDVQYPFDRSGVFGVTQCRVAEQRSDTSQPDVAGPDAVVPITLQVGQEVADQRSVDVGDVKVGCGLADAVLGEDEQQPQGVPVGGDGAGAGLPLGEQPVDKERLDGGREGSHRGSPA